MYLMLYLRAASVIIKRAMLLISMLMAGSVPIAAWSA
jgi:hypothetical protein